MKTNKILLFLILILAGQVSFSQISKSNITIKASGGKFFVSGVVADESIKNKVVEITNKYLGAENDFSKLQVNFRAKYFSFGWSQIYAQKISEIKAWKTGIFVFTHDEKNTAYLINLDEKFINAKILLTDNREIKLSDYGERLVVIFLTASWCSPCKIQAEEMNDFNKEIAPYGVEIIGLKTDDDPQEEKDFAAFVKKSGYNYKFGSTDFTFIEYLFDFSGFNGIPQTFLIKNGKIQQVFIGYSKSVSEKLKNEIRNSLNIKKGEYSK